jgi:hypothetical protein
VIAFIFPDAMGAIGQEEGSMAQHQHQRRDDCIPPTGTGALLRMMLLNRDTSTCRRSGLFDETTTTTLMMDGFHIITSYYYHDALAAPLFILLECWMVSSERADGL